MHMKGRGRMELEVWDEKAEVGGEIMVDGWTDMWMPRLLWVSTCLR